MKTQYFFLCGSILLNVALTFSSSVNRPCKTNSDCTFLISGGDSKLVNDRIILQCGKNNKCECVNSERSFWIREDDGKCLAYGPTPCGTSNGITLTCSDEADKRCRNICRKCIEGRCRATTKNRSRYEFCDETIDCQSGLVCRIVPRSVGKVCFEPEN